MEQAIQDLGHCDRYWKDNPDKEFAKPLETAANLDAIIEPARRKSLNMPVTTQVQGLLAMRVRVRDRLASVELRRADAVDHAACMPRRQSLRSRRVGVCTVGAGFSSRPLGSHVIMSSEESASGITRFADWVQGDHLPGRFQT